MEEIEIFESSSTDEASKISNDETKGTNEFDGTMVEKTSWTSGAIPSSLVERRYAKCASVLTMLERNEDKRGIEFSSEEIDRPSSSMSSDVAETSLAIGETRFGFSTLNTGDYGALMPLHSKFSTLKIRAARYLNRLRTPYTSSRTLSLPPFRTSLSRVEIAKLARQKLLRIAASTNNTAMVEEMLNNGTDPNCGDHRLRTPLHLASISGYTEIVRLLVQHGANPRAKDFRGSTPLHLAVVPGRIAIVNLLLSAGADPSSLDCDGCNPLQLAESSLKFDEGSGNPDVVAQRTEQREIVDALAVYMNKPVSFEKQLVTVRPFRSCLTLSNTSHHEKDELRGIVNNIDDLSLKT